MKQQLHEASGRAFGWRPELPDKRDRPFSVVRKIATTRLPTTANLTRLCSPVYDQGQLGSCVGNGWAAAVDFTLAVQKRANRATDDGKWFSPSRLFIYYNARLLEGTEDQDAGCYIRDGIKGIVQWGTPPEDEWKYDIDSFASKVQRDACLTDAEKHQALTYHRVDNTNADEIRACIAEGYPIVFGFTVYSNFMSDRMERSGTGRMPTRFERVEGGHCMVIVGYTPTRLICRNSWGEHWGKNGYCTLPWAYLTDANLADDFWTLRTMEA